MKYAAVTQKNIFKTLAKYNPNIFLLLEILFVIIIVIVIIMTTNTKIRYPTNDNFIRSSVLTKNTAV